MWISLHFQLLLIFTTHGHTRTVTLASDSIFVYY